MRYLKAFGWTALAVVYLAMAPAVALAAIDPSSAGNGLEPKLWALVAGLLVPLGGYLLNRALPTGSQGVRAAVQVVLAAVAGAIVELIDLGGDAIGFNTLTLEYVLTAVIAALGAHKWLWVPAGTNAVAYKSTDPHPPA